jgi:hypothetical protein
VIGPSRSDPDFGTIPSCIGNRTDGSPSEMRCAPGARARAAAIDGGIAPSSTVACTVSGRVMSVSMVSRICVAGARHAVAAKHTPSARIVERTVGASLRYSPAERFALRSNATITRDTLSVAAEARGQPCAPRANDGESCAERPAILRELSLARLLLRGRSP